MIYLKKTLVTLLLLSTVVCSTFAVDSSNVEQNGVDSDVETDIVLADADSNAEENVKVSDKKGGSGFAIFFRMLIVLVIVVGLIYLVFYFIKKKTNLVKSDDDYLRRAAYINIAPGKTVEVITLIDKAYLIGVTEDNITLLGEIKDEELIKAMNITADKKNHTKKPSTFSEVLDTFLTKGNKQKNVFQDAESKVDDIGKKSDFGV